MYDSSFNSRPLFSRWDGSFYPLRMQYYLFSHLHCITCSAIGILGIGFRSPSFPLGDPVFCHQSHVIGSSSNILLLLGWLILSHELGAPDLLRLSTPCGTMDAWYEQVSCKADGSI